MRSQKVYRVVIVKRGEITWVSGKFFATEHGAINDIEQRTSDDVKILGYKVEKYNLHPWNYFEMNEATTSTLLTVHLITNVIDEKKGAKATYGVVAYELK